MVAATAVFGTLCVIWYLFLVTTTRHPAGGGRLGSFIGAPGYWTLASVGAALFVGLAIELWRSCTSPPGLRLAHAAGALFASALVVAIEVLAYHSHFGMY
jgi:predicted branched-subunit amino acid permease